MGTAAFRNGTRTASAPTFKILYDTGNVTTQVSEPIARALGIDTTMDRPIDSLTIGTVSQGDVTVNGYMIEQFDLSTGNGMNKYTIDHPIIYVRSNRSDGSPPFPDNVDAVIGSNYFWNLKVVFDGPGATFGLFVTHP